MCPHCPYIEKYYISDSFARTCFKNAGETCFICNLIMHCRFCQDSSFLADKFNNSFVIIISLFTIQTLRVDTLHTTIQIIIISKSKAFYKTSSIQTYVNIKMCIIKNVLCYHFIPELDIQRYQNNIFSEEYYITTTMYYTFYLLFAILLMLLARL